MTDFAQLISGLRRPRLLIRAAHHGLQEYNRNRHLRRVLNGAAPSPLAAMAQLVETEEQLEEARRRGGADYSVARHVDVLIAMIGEMRLIRRGEPA